MHRTDSFGGASGRIETITDFIRITYELQCSFHREAAGHMKETADVMSEACFGLDSIK